MQDFAYGQWHNPKKALIFPNVDVSGAHCSVNHYMLEDHAGAVVYDWVDVVSELYVNGKYRHAKQIVDL